MEYLFEFLAPSRRTVFTDFVTVRIRHHDDPNRITKRFQHYELAMTGHFFAESKANLIREGRLNIERSSALDFHIMANAYALLRVGRHDEAELLFDKISWTDVGGYDWCHVGSVAWAGRWGGRKMGTRSFYYLNKFLGRI
jgi:hypothetical protein